MSNVALIMSRRSRLLKPERGFKQGMCALQTKYNGQPAVVACGSNHSVLISRRGELFTWGLSSSGELGHEETPIDLNVPRQVYIEPMIEAYPFCAHYVLISRAGPINLIAPYVLEQCTAFVNIPVLF